MTTPVTAPVSAPATAPAGPAAPSAGAAPAPPGPELPVHLTTFVGRSAELGDLERLIGGSRLLTLTGAGGSGKTRLAREIVLRVAEGFQRTAWVDLGPLAQPELVAQLIAAALRVPERAGAAYKDLVIAAIGGDRVLLVLDNCEHLVDACAELAEALLRACPRLTVLATSREALGVQSETAWLVPPLACSEATDLFVDRARGTLPSFARTTANSRAVEEICRRLDGIPLAIELAAARVRVLTPEQIAQRLDDAFQLLTQSSRTALPRHRTLRATMEWSYGLLSAREQVLLRRLSVFAGTFTLESAEAVCAGSPLEVDDILDGVAALVDKSLVLMEPGDGMARYRLLETVRQYAREQLDASGEQEALERRFAEHFLALLEEAEPTLIGGANSPEMLARVLTEMDNLRAAATWGVSHPDRAQIGLRFVGAGFWVCYAQGMFREMRQLTDVALGLTDRCPPLVRGRALAASALTALAQGEYERSYADFESALPLLRAAGDERGTATALAKQGAARLLGGDVEGAIRLLDEALAYTQDWVRWDIPVVFARFWRAWAAYATGDLERAHAWMADNLRVGREHVLPSTRGHATAALGRIELARGRVEEACRLAEEALVVEVAIADGWGIALALDVVAMAAGRRGHPETATRLLAGTEAHRARIALALPGPAPMERIGLIEQLRAELDARFDELWAEGLALSTDETVALARAELASASGAGAAGTIAAPDGAGAPARGAAAPSGAASASAHGGRTRLRVVALGPLQVSVDDRPVEASAWGSARPRELLVYLLMHPEGRTKEQAGLAFWPDASPAQLRNNFHVTLHRLRKALGGSDWVALEGERYRIDPELVELDAVEFEREVAAARRQLKRQAEGAAAELEGVLARYRGDFLDGEPAGDWHVEHRDRLQRIHLDALMELGRHHAREERHERAADVYRRVLARDELQEEAVRALMAALAEAGDRSQALRVYQRFAERLERELGADPEEETLRLLERLQGG